MRQRREVSVDGVYRPRFGLAMRWAISTGRALAYLHGLKHPIIHRDVKPLNLFLNQDLEAGSQIRGELLSEQFQQHFNVDTWIPFTQLSLMENDQFVDICRSFTFLNPIICI